MDSLGESDRVRISRRDFFQVSSLAGVGLWTATAPVLSDEMGTGFPTLEFRVRRTRDLMDLLFRFVNFTIDGQELVALGGDKSLISVQFPPQNLGEAIFSDPDPDSECKLIPKSSSTPENPLAACRAPIESYLSGPSWIVFQAPDGVRLPLTGTQCGGAGPSDDPCCNAGQAAQKNPATNGGGENDEKCVECCRGNTSPIDYWLRVMGDWKIKVPSSALKTGTARAPTSVTAPSEQETSLEIPFRLMIAPTSEDVWVAASGDRLPYDSLSDHDQNAKAVLWHAAVRTREKLSPAKPPQWAQNLPQDVAKELAAPTRVTLQARAVYSPDYDLQNPPSDKLYYPDSRPLSLHAVTRHALVKQMSEGDGWIDAENIVLSALGANANLSYTTQKEFASILAAQLSESEPSHDVPGPSEPATLALWRHRIVVGRDVFTAEVFFVFLLPTKNEALWVEITQRRFASVREALNSEKHGPPGAFLLKRRYLLVQNPMQQFPSADNAMGRMMPFKRLDILQLRSPYVADPLLFPLDDDLNSLTPPNAGIYFIPRKLSDHQVVRWKLGITDGGDTCRQTDDACYLVASNVIWGQRLWQDLKPEFREWRVPAQNLAYAPQEPVISVRKSLTKSASPSAADDLIFRHVFDASERSSARLVGDGLRAWLQTEPSLSGQLDFLKNLTRDKLAEPLRLIRETTDGIRTLRDESIAKLADAARAIDGAVTEKKAAVEELLRQLGRCEQTSTTLETHAITLDCHRVQNLYDLLAALKAAAVVAGGDTVNSYVDRVRAALGPLGTDVNGILRRVNGQLEALKQAFTGDLPGVDKAVNDYLAELDGWKNAAADAFGVKYFQAALNEAKVAIPALKAMAG